MEELRVKGERFVYVEEPEVILRMSENGHPWT